MALITGAPQPTSNIIPQFNTNNYAPPPQPWDKRYSDFSPEDQQLITQISSKLGFQGAPLGVRGGQIIGSGGNALDMSVDRFGGIMDAIIGGADINSLQQSGRFLAPSTPSAQPAQPAPQYGLGAAESALTAGAQSGLDILQYVKPELGTTPQISAPTLGATPQIDLSQPAGVLSNVANKAGQFVDPGQQAQYLQAAMSGAFGPEAQAQAYQNFNNSPGQQYALEQSEEAILRNAAATGGLSGGNVLRELQKNAIGLAQQNIQQQFQNLGSVSGQGLNALGIQGNLAVQEADLLGRGVLSQADLQQQRDLTGAQYGLTADIETGRLGANRQNTYDQIMANLGITGANMAYGLGSDLGNYRMRTAENIADQTATTYANLGNLATGQAGDIAGTVESGTGSAIDLQTSAASLMAQLPADVQNLLISLATQQGTQQSGYELQAGVAEAEGDLAAAQAGAAAVGEAFNGLAEI